MVIILFAILGYVFGCCCACIRVIEKQHAAIRKATIHIQNLQRENENLFRQHLNDNGISLENLSDKHGH